MSIKFVIFDVNGTLIDLSALESYFSKVGVNDAKSLLKHWFASVLRDGLALCMADAAVSFPQVAKDALKLLLPADSLNCPLKEACDCIMDGFGKLPVCDDVSRGMRVIADANAGLIKMATLTNGSASVASQLLTSNGLSEFIPEQLRMSVDDAPEGMWKPSKSAYLYAAHKLQTEPSEICLVAVHPWDIAGAKNAGFKTAYLSRDGKAYPECFPQPDVIGISMFSVAQSILDMSNN